MNNLMHTKKEKLRNPFLFQGEKETQGYFEGWYYKQVNATRGQTVSVIFGVSLNVDQAHAFIQLLLSNPLRTFYFEYPVSDFVIASDCFHIGPNRFCEHGLSLNLHQSGIDCVGNLAFTHLTPLRSTVYMPTIMGPFAYIPHMECNHGVVSMRHAVQGRLAINGEEWVFDKDVGYIEKDWGRSFPKRYVWLQGNHFLNSDASLMVSVADIPFLGWTFEGVIAQLDFMGKSIRIATYLGARKGKLSRSADGFTLTVKQGALRLFIEAKMDETGILKAPKLGAMHHSIKEGLGGTINVRLYRKDELIWEDASRHCGIEIEGYK
jgi:tocopherol cyclase